jgi:hypothetical protein
MTTKAAAEEEMVSSLNLTIAEKALQFFRKTPTCHLMFSDKCITKHQPTKESMLRIGHSNIPKPQKFLPNPRT